MMAASNLAVVIDFVVPFLVVASLAMAVCVMAFTLVAASVRLREIFGERRALATMTPAVDFHIVAAAAVYVECHEGVLSARQLVALASYDPMIAAAFERRGCPLGLVLQGLRLAASPKPYEFDEEIARAAQSARRAVAKRGEQVWSMVDLLTALARGVGPAGDFLRSLHVTFDDSQFVAVCGEPRDSSEAYLYMWNDATTPMEVVATILEELFQQLPLVARYTMLSVHFRGYAPLGPFAPEEARRLRSEAMRQARAAGYELRLADERPDTTAWSSGDRGLLPS